MKAISQSWKRACLIRELWK